MVYNWIYIRSLIVLIMPDFDKTFENEVNSFKDKEIYQLKKNMAIKVEEIQALYMEVKQQRKINEQYQKLNGQLRLEIEETKKKADKLMIDKVTKYENQTHSLKQQIKQLEKEAEEMLLYPWLYLANQYIENIIDLY